MTIEKKLKGILAVSKSELKKEVINDLLDSEDTAGYIKEIINHGCQSGVVSGLIYYADTKAFYIKHLEDIEDMIADYQENTGEMLQPKAPYYNWFAWFAFEETVRELADSLEIEY
jgi:hypothetical protein